MEIKIRRKNAKIVIEVRHTLIVFIMVNSPKLLSKQHITLLSALQLSLSRRCERIRYFLSVSKCYLIVVVKWRVFSQF